MVVQHSIANGQLIYVVDDDATISQLVAVNLQARGYRVRRFDQGAEVLTSVETDEPALMVLDIIMPGINGLVLAREVRRLSQVPILMLSVRDEISTKLSALDLGADDYLTKPFRMEELLAWVRAILRRAGQPQVGPPLTTYCVGQLVIDLERDQVSSHHRPVKLTAREWAVLRVLIAHAGRVVTPRQLLREARGPEYGDEGDYIRTYITRLRKKLEPEPKNPRYILLERGIGYRLLEPN